MQLAVRIAISFTCSWQHVIHWRGRLSGSLPTLATSLHYETDIKGHRPMEDGDFIPDNDLDAAATVPLTVEEFVPQQCMVTLSAKLRDNTSCN